MATWLEQVNIYRLAATLWPGSFLSSVTEDPVLSDACRKLAQYEVDNPPLSHLDGQKNNPNFTAAQNSNLWGGWGALASEPDIVNEWGLSIFHGLSMIDPRLNKVGFGSYSTADPNRSLKAVAALNILQGVTGAVPPPSSDPSGVWSSNAPWPAPVVFPGMGKSFAASYAHYVSSEQPDARTSTQCNYTGTAGLPISIQVGRGGVSETQGSWLKFNVPGQQQSIPVEICIIDENNFTNSNSTWQQVGRDILSYRGAVVLLPRYPLMVGQYTAHIQVSTQPRGQSPQASYEWTFNVGEGTFSVGEVQTLPAGFSA